MGVHGLWELLAPVGRRVSVETLAGKKLAIDASIWMIQFMKAMRDEKGEMVRNAHILGFFRRICKLLYLRTKPVFVFDGGTPALKRRTVIARRRQRENAQAKIRKTAEKLLLNQLKAMRLKELAADLERQRQENDTKGKRPIIQEPSNEQEARKGNDDAPISYNQEELDEMLAASIAAEDNEGYSIGASTSGSPPDDEVFEEDDEEDEEMILPEMHGKVDPAVLAALPPSMQLDLLVQMRERLMAENRQKYQKVKKAPARFSELQIEAYLKTVAFRREIDGVQKSAAGRGIGGVQTSRIASEANREFIFSSSFTGDKEALTSVGQERNRADGVQADQVQSPPVNSSASAVNKFQSTKRSDAAAGPTVTETGKAFHDEVETYLDERGRLRVSRVRALGIRMTRDLQRNLDLMKEIDQEKAKRNQEKNNKSATASNPVDVLDNSSGKIQHREATDKNNDGMDNAVDKTKVPAAVNRDSIEISFEDTLKHDEYGDDDDKLFARLVAGDPVMDFSADNSALAKESLNSASDNEWEEGVIEGKSTEHLHEGGTSDEGDVEWEEGFQDVQLKSLSCPDESQKTATKGALEEEAAFQEAIRRSLEDKSGSMDDFLEHNTSGRTTEAVSDDEEVEWEEGFQDIQLKSSDESQKIVTKGVLEEEAAFQEAIRRSLEDTRGSMDDFHENHTSQGAREMVPEETVCVSMGEGKERPDVETLRNDVSGPFGSMNDLDATCSNEKPTASTELNPDEVNFELKLLNQDTSERGALDGEVLVPSDALPGGKGFFMMEKKPLHACGEAGDGPAMNILVGTCSEKVAHNSSSSAFSSSFTDSSHDTFLDSGFADALHMFQAELDDHFLDTEKPGKTAPDDSVTDVDGTKELAEDKKDDDFPMEKDEFTRNDNEEHQIMEDHLEEEMSFLGKEREELGTEQRKLERDAESVSNEMFAECQELLQMFGLPYIIAPMEAEAQCAFMELSNLVDGVVTDDSDAFLFGAQSVYKNIFDDRKYVETYLMKDIENELGLDQEKLIHMALLLGSDYTEGISGIGIVNAIEVVNAFPGKDGLHEFREWIESTDPSILGKLDVDGGGNSKKKGSKATQNTMSGSNSNVEEISCDENAPQLVDDAERKRQIFMDKHRNVSKNWHISSSFPSDAVISAYASPQVDNSTEPFAWGKPDLFVLRKLCWEKFGWGASKADELLLPVLKEYNKHETQLRLEAFYTFNERFAKIRSKRIKKAVKGITGSKSSAVLDETPQQSGSGKKRKEKPSKDEGNETGVDSTGVDGAGASNQNNTMEKPPVKQLKRGRTQKKNSQRNLEQSTSVGGHVMSRKESHARGHRGRGRGQRGGRGKRKNSSRYADTEITNDDGSSSENDDEMQLQISEEAHQVRRSVRERKSVNYAMSNEFDNSDKEDEAFLEGDLLAESSFVGQEVGDIEKSDRNQLNEGSDEIRVGSGLPVEETEHTSRTDKVSTSMIDDGQMDDPPDQGQASKDYLQLGGGFCLDEDDENELNGQASSPIRETIPKRSSVLTGADSVVDDNHESNPSVISPRSSNGMADLSDNEVNRKDDTENDPRSGNPTFLRAMPNLRRKKRKT